MLELLTGEKLMRKHLCVGGLLWLYFPILVVASTDDILGVWNTAKGHSRVEIYKCDDRYCGRIIWLKEPLYSVNDNHAMAGKPKVDLKNPDIALRTQQLEGLEILHNFQYDNGQWNDGTIYDPQEGKTYSCKLSLSDNGILYVRGYVGISLFGRTTTWTR